MQTKSELRQHFRKLRQQISPSDRESAAQAAALLLVQQAFFKRSQHIACYFAVNDEFDTRMVIEAIWQAGKYCYLPVIAEQKEKILSFVRYTDGDALEPNQYHILEPVDKSNALMAAELDLVILPLLAFDDQGHRLGTGGGYYDRSFAFLGEQERKIALIGLAYARQQADSLPVDPWDIGLDAVLTEEGCRGWIIP